MQLMYNVVVPLTCRGLVGSRRLHCTAGVPAGCRESSLMVISDQTARGTGTIGTNSLQLAQAG